MMRSRYLILLLASVPALPAAAQISAPTTSPFVDRLRAVLPSGEYVRRAAAYELYQRQAAQAILKTSRNPEIRKLAQQFLAEHGRAAADLRTAAAKSGIRIDAALSTIELKQMVQKLGFATGDVRDTLYLSQQRTVHGRALAMHQDYASAGDQPALKEAAARFVTLEQAHLELITRVGTTVPLPVSTPPAPPSPMP
jgi:putative membrane protein